MEWDFKLPRVVSINTSGHKFGLAYVGVGWVVWRDKAHLPKDLIFELHYLGSVEYSFSLNFSRPAAPIIAQYFNLIHLGFEGYRNVELDDLKNARLLSRALENSGYYTVLSDIHRKVGSQTTAAKMKEAVGLDDDETVRSPASPWSLDDQYILCCRVMNLVSLLYLSASLTSSSKSTRRSNRPGSRHSFVLKDGKALPNFIMNR